MGSHSESSEAKYRKEFMQAFNRNAFFISHLANTIKSGASLKRNDDATILLNRLIDEYGKFLRQMLKKNPYQEITGILTDMMASDKVKYPENKANNSVPKRKPESNPDSDINHIFNQITIDDNLTIEDIFRVNSDIRKALKQCISSLRGDRKKADLMRKHARDYSTLLLCAIIIKLYKGGDTNNFIHSMICLENLFAVDLVKVVDLHHSQNFIKFIIASSSARGPNKQWKTSKQLNEKAVEIIYKLWNDGDQRKHDKIAKDVVNKINAPIERPFKEQLLKLYPNKDFDDDEKKSYETELKKLTRGKVASSATVMRMIFDRAVEIGRANDPHKGRRKWERSML